MRHPSRASPPLCGRYRTRLPVTETDGAELEQPALTALLDGWGEPAYRLRQAVEAQLRGADDWSAVTAFPATLRERLTGALPLWSLQPEARQEAADGTLKWRLRAADGALVEAVLIPHAAGRGTVCISSQAGCALGCRFCATGALGPGRDLTASEMVDQALLAARETQAGGGRLANVVFMGMGEPLQNLDAVLAACDRVHDGAGGGRHAAGPGLSARRIAISTAGWVPGIARLAAHPLPVRLAVSLHAADDETRSELMPINRRYPIASLLAACRRYCDTTGRRVFIEYLLLDGVNDAPADARRLAELVRDGRFHVNLIEYNATPGAYRASPRARRAAFVAVLTRAGIAPSLRRSRGSDIAAACGQLALAGGRGAAAR
jgi:23S rRNA (adenine2503-C2)-methyltransferase